MHINIKINTLKDLFGCLGQKKIADKTKVTIAAVSKWNRFGLPSTEHLPADHARSTRHAQVIADLSDLTRQQVLALPINLD